MPDAEVRVAKKRTFLSRAVRFALGLGLLDLVAVVLSGGFSLLGPVEEGGVIFRLLLVSGILLLDQILRKGSRSGYDTGYIALLLVLVALLHFRGYRLRGDGLWYYSFAHSLAFDGDIDLANQYQSLGIEREAGSRPVRETGLARFTYPVGAPGLWVPFVEIGHLGVALRRAFGDDAAYDGFSDPYFHAVALGNLLAGWVGLVLLDRLLRRWFPPWISFLAGSGIVLGSFLAWYLTYHAIYTHALTFLLVTLVVKLWTDDPATAADYAVLGFVLGLATAVRWQ
ncbi:MAG TPA: hypothetical protein VLK65_02445, partial [Vicinamibacteria bacterium]|nr:hypothetical protein [Vicinamibacteria bacterium]